MTYEELETAYITLTRDVQKRARSIMGLAANKRSEEAACEALALSDFCANTRNQFQMEKESADAGRYDLAALTVEPGTLTNSETAYERED